MNRKASRMLLLPEALVPTITDSGPRCRVASWKFLKFCSRIDSILGAVQIVDDVVQAHLTQLWLALGSRESSIAGSFHSKLARWQLARPATHLDAAGRFWDKSGPIYCKSARLPRFPRYALPHRSSRPACVSVGFVLHR